MPSYFFEIEDGSGVEDDDGIELPNLGAAREQAVRLMGELLRDRPVALWAARRWRLTVKDADKRPLFKIAVTVTPS